MTVNTWQDGAVEKESEIRVVEDVEVLKALAEPTRLAILEALMEPPWPRIMAVKELAAELGMAPTRLYRHVRQLEEANLIKVAETRMVSGILEQRYQASARDLRLGQDILRTHPDESMAALHVLIDQFGQGLLTATEKRGYKPQMCMSENRLPAEAADELQRRLLDIREWLAAVPEDPDGVPVNVMIGFYVG
jgi:DNA-binding transcriptional ArsR family regulator